MPNTPYSGKSWIPLFFYTNHVNLNYFDILSVQHQWKNKTLQQITITYTVVFRFLTCCFSWFLKQVQSKKNTIDSDDICIKIQRQRKCQLLDLCSNQLEKQVQLHHYQRRHLSKDPKTEEVPVAWLDSKSTWWPDQNYKLVLRGLDPQFWLIDQCPWTLDSLSLNKIILTLKTARVVHTMRCEHKNLASQVKHTES